MSELFLARALISSDHYAIDAQRSVDVIVTMEVGYTFSNSTKYFKFFNKLKLDASS
jgi:hypothetical protein